MFYRWVGTLLLDFCCATRCCNVQIRSVERAKRRKLTILKQFSILTPVKNSHNTVITSLACTMTTMWTLHEFYISDFLVFR